MGCIAQGFDLGIIPSSLVQFQHISPCGRSSNGLERQVVALEVGDSSSPGHPKTHKEDILHDR